MTAHRFCCPYFHIPQGRESVRGKPLRVSPLAFSHPPAGDHFCTAKVPHQKRRGTRTCVSSFLVRAMGLEPTRPYGHKHLKLACLPIPASPQISLFIISDNFAFVKHKNLHFRFLFYAVAFVAFYLPAVTVSINVTLPKHLSSARRFRPRTRFPTQNTYPSNRTR